MVGTRGSTLEFSGPAFEAAVQRAVDALLPGLTTRLTNEIRQNGNGGSNCPLQFDDKIRSANLFPLDMNDFDIKFLAWVG
ncbi:hypothetical protein Tco_1099015 [Tanacetum coccineum]